MFKERLKNKRNAFLIDKNLFLAFILMLRGSKDELE